LEEIKGRGGEEENVGKSSTSLFRRGRLGSTYFKLRSPTSMLLFFSLP